MQMMYMTSIWSKEKVGGDHPEMLDDYKDLLTSISRQGSSDAAPWRTRGRKDCNRR